MTGSVTEWLLSRYLHDGQSLDLEDRHPTQMSLMMCARLMHGVSCGVSQSWALCSVSCPACLCMSLNTDINIQRSASCEPRVTAGRLNHCDHDGQTPGAAGGRETVSVSGQ